jgi:DNA polymerase sigma
MEAPGQERLAAWASLVASNHHGHPPGESEPDLLRPQEFVDCTLITTARVPILTLKVGGCPFLDDAALATLSPADGAMMPESEADICVEHALVLRNTELLRTYAMVDERARLLMIAVKLWAKRSGVADAANGTLSS